ncbi:hypothetical protein [Massilia sp. MS-15]|uniref:hypothetical protein n=1 Tax=Massilia sp. MS-15 TaxID=2878200 RepID=UPI001CD6CA15|nr:hypothetical protein [Massilia sp. MS-15]MCA1245528.1 hypothetical protein [Massilia sp. MS-15]
MKLSYRTHLILLGVLLAILSACAPSDAYRSTRASTDPASLTAHAAPSVKDVRNSMVFRK